MTGADATFSDALILGFDTIIDPRESIGLSSNMCCLELLNVRMLSNLFDNKIGLNRACRENNGSKNLSESSMTCFFLMA